MAVTIHCAPQLHKCLSKLRKAGGRAALAAARIDVILTTLATQDGIRPEEVNKLTRRGEARIEHCKKFDLVGGYRLVYIKEEQHYYFLFAGTHDACDRWLSHHRDLKPEILETPASEPVAQRAETLAAVVPETPPDAMDYDDIVCKDLDDKMLRRVFRGLCGP